MRRLFGVGLAAAVLAACGASGPHENDAGFDSGRPDAGHDAGVDAGLDAGLDAGTDAGLDAGVDAGPPDGSVFVIAPATHATATEPFTLDVDGQGTTDFGPVTVRGDVATQLLHGESYASFAYETQTFSGYPYVLFDLLGVEDGGGDLSVSYLYCAQTPDLSYIYSESVFHPLKEENASGYCDGGAQTTPVTVDLPAVNFHFVPFDTGITIDAGTLVLSAAGGTVSLPNGVHQLWPFETVDCTSCPGGPWYELHAIISDSTEACFGIVYVFPDQPTQLQLGYTVCLPTLNETQSELFTGSWSGTLNTHPPRGPGVSRPMLPRPLPPGWR